MNENLDPRKLNLIKIKVIEKHKPSNKILELFNSTNQRIHGNVEIFGNAAAHTGNHLVIAFGSV